MRPRVVPKLGRARLRGLSVVETQRSAEALLGSNGAIHVGMNWSSLDQLVVDSR